jgi:hypothetical protein
MTRIVSNIMLVVALAVAGAASCSKSANDGIPSFGDLLVNGPGIDGSVKTGAQRFYMLKSINNGQRYTIRTGIGLLADGTTDGFLTVSVYAGEAAVKNKLPPEPVSIVPLSAPYGNVYEGSFTAQAPTGDYVIVLSGESSDNGGVQTFYDLRIMTTDAAALTPFAQPSVPASDSQLLNPGYLAIYSGAAITSTGTFTVGLTSAATATILYPQLFIYGDGSLSLGSLILSSIPTSTNFNVTTFTSGAAVTVSQDADVISGVTFTGGGPYIVLKGIGLAQTYTLSVVP